MIRSILATLLCLLVVTPAGMAQQPLAEPQVGSISGVTLDSGGQPVRGARLVLTRLESRGEWDTRSGEGGRFRFEEIEPGRYRLQAQHAAYVPQQYGQTTPDRPTATIDVTLDQPVPHVVFRLIRAGVLAGRIYRQDGQPLAGAEVRLLQSLYSGSGCRVLSDAEPNPFEPGRFEPAKTDDRGQYRFFGLAPGSYYVRVAYDPSETRRSPMVVKTMAPTYYPGVASAAEAVSVHVLPGLELTAIDFTFNAVPKVRVLGRTINPLTSDGSSRIDTFYLVPRDCALGERPESLRNYATGDDEFEIRGVPPGSYTLYAAYGIGRPPEITFYSGSTSVDVFDRDVTGLTVTIDPGVLLTGRILTDESLSASPIDLTQFIPLLFAADEKPGILAPTAFLGRNQMVEADGTFEIPAAARGRYRLVLTPRPPEDVYLAAARLGAENILGRAFDLSGDPPGELVLELRRGGGQIQGAVTDQQGNAMGQAHVVLVPGQPFRGDQEAYKTVYPDQSGRFTIRRIRPGAYRLFAFTMIPHRAWMNDRFMAPYWNRGVVINVDRNEEVEQGLVAIATGP